jgi:hypothetical protein
VPRFLPKLAGLGRTFADMEFHWRRVLAKEYGTMVGWPVRWILVFMWSLWRDGGSGEVVARLPQFGVIVLVLLIFYLSVRTLKKRRQLVAD